VLAKPNAAAISPRASGVPRTASSRRIAAARSTACTVPGIPAPYPPYDNVERIVLLPAPREPTVNGHATRAAPRSTLSHDFRSTGRPAMSSTRSQARQPGLWVRMRQNLGGEMMAEFLGTFVLVLLGCGSVAVALVGLPGSGRQTGDFGPANWLIIAWGWGLAVTFGVYVAGGVTGAHINPAVTLAWA